MLSLSYLLAGMVIVFFHIVASILVNMMAGKEVRATAQTLLVVFGSGVGPMLSNYLAGVLTQQAGNSLRPVFGLGMLLAFGACLLIVSRYRSLARYLSEQVIPPGLLDAWWRACHSRGHLGLFVFCSMKQKIECHHAPQTLPSLGRLSPTRGCRLSWRHGLARRLRRTQPAF